MYLARRRLLSSKYEDRLILDEKWMREQLVLKNRFEGSISEAWVESQATCRLQVSYYLAFSYMIKNPKWSGANCIAKTILEDHKDLITWKDVAGWHKMPPLLFSALMSLISITATQMMLYNTK